MFPIVALLAQVVAAPIHTATDERPVRLWLGSSPVAPGETVPVYVATASSGYLLVLRVATDGRVDVVFPDDPAADGYVGRGAYELRARGNRPALVANEPRGTGLVLAALSATPFRFGEFARAGRWDRGLLVASYPGADGPGTLSDIAQRMVGDGWFNSDFALYTVRTRGSALQEPRAVARGQNDDAPPVTADIAVCNGCTIVYQTVSPAPILEQTVIERTIVEPIVIFASQCDPFVGGCHQRRHRRDDAPPVKTEGICQIGIDCPPGAVGQGKAITQRRASLSLSPIGRSPIPAPQPAPPEMTVPVPVAAASQRIVFVTKAAPAASVTNAAPARRVSSNPPPAAAAVSPQQGRTVAMPRASGGMGMSARQAGTALRAARLLPRGR